MLMETITDLTAVILGESSALQPQWHLLAGPSQKKVATPQRGRDKETLTVIDLRSLNPDPRGQPCRRCTGMGRWPGWLLSLLKVALPAADHKNDLEVLAPHHPH